MHAVQEVIRLEGGNNYIESRIKFYKLQQTRHSMNEYTTDHGGDDGLEMLEDDDDWESDESDTL